MGLLIYSTLRFFKITVFIHKFIIGAQIRFKWRLSVIDIKGDMIFEKIHMQNNFFAKFFGKIMVKLVLE